MRESAVVLEQKSRLRREGSAYIIPVNRVGEINIEISDNRPSRHGHVSRRWKVGLLHVLQLADQGLLRRTTGTGIPFDRTLVDHDCECKARMSFGFSHHKFRGLVDAIVRPVPVDNHSVNSAADHVCDLPVDLFCVCGTVTDIHVVRTSEP